MPGPETEQGLERSHRLLASIMAKDEFIKISLELVAPYAVMGSEQPLLQVADGAVRVDLEWMRIRYERDLNIR